MSGPMAAWMLVGLCLAEDTVAANPVLAELTGQGIAVAADQSIRLPPPLLARITEPAAQRAAILQQADRYAWDDLTRNSPVAPHVLRLQSITDSAGQRIGQRASLYFVAHGTLADVRDRKLAERLGAGGSAEEESHELTAEELAQRRIVPLSGPGQRESYVFARAVLLERVELATTSRTVAGEDGRSLLLAGRVDPRFDGDARFANRWRPIRVDEFGQKQRGEPEPYSALGNYVHVSQLAEPAGGLFVEWQLVMAEPHGWFGGKNLLGSKLPPMIQDSVKKFRQQLRAR